MKRCFSIAAIALMVALSLSAQSKQKIFHLAIGDAERRTRDARVVLDGITDSATGDVLSANQLAARLRETRLLLVGESHTPPTSIASNYASSALFRTPAAR